ncbi:hypothetical protein D3C77_787950 [compost metagenome]
MLAASRRVRFRSRLSSACPPLFKKMSPLFAMASVLVAVRRARPLLPIAPVLASRAV